MNKFDLAWIFLKTEPVRTLFACGLCNAIYDNKKYAHECCKASPSFNDYEEKVGEYGPNEEARL
jgi:hypothetical protein